MSNDRSGPAYPVNELGREEKLLTVEEAQAASAAADCRVRQLSNELDEAKRLADEARKAVSDARVRADAHLPRATEVTVHRGGGRTRRGVVVVRKTATLATVRPAGGERESKYRLNGKTWEPSPKPKRDGWRYSWTTLEFPEVSDE